MIRRHTVQVGERLADLAQQYYGDPRMVGPIFRHNPEILDPNQLSLGQVLTIPYVRLRG